MSISVDRDVSVRTENNSSAKKPDIEVTKTPSALEEIPSAFITKKDSFHEI